MSTGGVAGGDVPGGEPAPATPPTCYRHEHRETYIRCQRCDRSICPDCMRDAAVGFQCPDCVRKGITSTRQGLTPYGGRRSSDPRLTSLVLIGLNLAVFVAVQATGRGASGLVDRLALLPATAVAGFSGGRPATIQGVADGAYWQLLTSAFVHVALLHIAFNMLALYILGPLVENVLGRVRFLAIYLASALAGSAAVMALSAPNSQTVGASGAIFGIMGALAVLALKVRGEAQQVLVWIGINLLLTFTIPSISWQGHLGGLLAGAMLGAAMVYAPRQRRALLQWGAVGVVVVASLALIVVRIVVLG